MAAVNYYAGVKRGANADPENAVVFSATTSAGTAVDVEVRMQINNGSANTGLNQKDVVEALATIQKYILGNGEAGAGTAVPPPC